MTANKTYKLLTLGCKVNQAESLGLEQQLKEMGYQPSTSDDTADICIVNTCTVTQKASMQSRQEIRKLKRRYPGCRTIVTGCYAQVDPDGLRRIKEIDAVVGNTCKHQLTDIIKEDFSNSPAPQVHHQPLDIRPRFEKIGTTQQSGRTRGFLKIQDGCNARCSYCIVPDARGASRSLPLSEVHEALEQMAANGYREIILTGVHLGCYGLDLKPATSLVSLLTSFERPATLDRIRISSIEPNEISHGLLDCLRSLEWICPHLHLPLQSGDNTVLRRMGRPYTREDFAGTVERVLNAVPQMAIGLDVLVGFPGESAEAFQNTCELVESLPIAYLHVFPFSSRPGTPAAGFSDQVPAEAIKARCRKVREIGKKKRKAFFTNQLGQFRQVLVEGVFKKNPDYMKGLSADYIPVLIKRSAEIRPNQIYQVRLRTIDPLFDHSVIGEACHDQLSC